jgi:hypothetical protein
MKKAKIALLALVATVFILPACKKGPDDPFLTIRGRKDRLCQTWTLSSGSTTEISGGTTTIDTYTSSIITETSGGATGSAPHTETLTFNTDGSYEIQTSTTYPTFTVTDDNKGYWYFGRKNKGLGIKAKEEVVLVCTSDINTDSGTSTVSEYTGSDCPTSTFLLDELKHSEIIIKLDGTNLSGGSLDQITGTKTYSN